MAQNDVEAKVRLVVDSKAFNATLKQANKEAKEFKRQQSSAFKGAGDDISKAFGNAIGTVTKLAPALSAGAAAMAVARKAMQENQTLTDEWARITESARSTYEGFVNSLVTGNLTGFFSNMDDIIAKARDVADAFDALDTAKLFSGRESARLGMEQEKYLSILRNKNISAEEKAEAETALKEIFRQMDDETRKMSNYRFEAFAKRFVSNMAEHGSNVDWQSVIRRNEAGDYELTSSSAYQTYFNTLADYEGAVKRRDEEAKARGFYFNGKEWLKGEGALIGKGKGNMTDAEFAELNAAIQMSDEGIKELFSLLEGAYNDRAQYYRNIGRANRYLNSGGSGGGGGSTSKVGDVFAEGSIGWVEQEVVKANKEWKSAVTEGERQAAQARLKVLQEELEVLRSGKISTDKLSPLGVDTPTGLFNPTDITAPTWRANIDIKQQKTLGKVTEDALQRVSNLTDVIGKLGIVSMFTGGEVDKTTAIIGRIVQIVGSAIGGPAGGVFASLGSLIAGGFATGGIVGGTSYKGDKLTAQVSSGEMILNKAQQRNLLAIAGGGGAPSVTAVEVRGDKMVLLINNTLRQQGKSTIG
ncbi:MAG: hypothetical protein J6U93_01865 [Alistipes sp.]|nr:hypothetical protein [Alistipes sp.]